MRAVGFGTSIPVLVLGAMAIRLHPMWPGASIPGATRLQLDTQALHLIPGMGCPLAPMPRVRFATAGDWAGVVDPISGARLPIRFPSGFSAWLIGDRVVLLDRGGAALGIDGDTLGEGLAGGWTEGDDAFLVCVPFN